jgi:glycosyltransferase involved in cell wall biosynthesis
MDKKDILRVGFFSPGWPLKNFPNGIVAYIQNITYGQEDKIEPVIFANSLVDDKPKNDLIDLSSLINDRSLLDKILDKIIYTTKLECFAPIRYKREIEQITKKISIAIKQLNPPLNILEIEESFGLAHFLVKKTNVPIVTRIHGPWVIHGPIMQMDSSPDYKSRVFYEGEAIKNSHGVTAPCLDVLERVRDYYGIELPNARVIPNPVLEVPKDKHWQYDTSNSPFILVVARFDLHKGGDLAVDAFRYIALKNKDIELFFVGPDRGLTVKGNQFHFNAYLERYVPEEAIKKRIRFLGHCDQAHISDLRKRSLVTMVCSRYENFPLSLLEALSAGCPTVATAVGGMKEIITNDYNGLLASTESPQDIADKVLSLINDPIKMQFLSKNAIEDCKKRFSPEVVATQTHDFYKSVIASN